MKVPFCVVKCSNVSCSRYTYAKLGQKTKQCPFCGKRFSVKTNTIKVVDSLQKAQLLVKKFNTRLGLELHKNRKGKLDFEPLG